MALKINSKTKNNISESIQKDYEQLWKDISGDFLTGGTMPVLRAYAEPDKGIPYIEISDRITVSSPILFVGMNPSGADVKSYSGNSLPVFIYEGNSSFYQAMDKFAKECLTGIINNPYYSELDLFGIVQRNQSVVQKHLKGNVKPYDKMFNMFLKNLVRVNPKVVVVANGFASKIVKKELSLQFCSYGRYELSLNPKFGGYNLNIDNNTFQVYFSTMLSGGHLDNGSRENLVWLVRNYLSNNP